MSTWLGAAAGGKLVTLFLGSSRGLLSWLSCPPPYPPNRTHTNPGRKGRKGSMSWDAGGPGGQAWEASGPAVCAPIAGGVSSLPGGGEDKKGGTCRDRHKRGRRQCFRDLGEGDSGCKTQFNGVGVGTQAQPRTRNRSLSSSSGQIPPPETLEERQRGRDPGKIFPGPEPAAATKVRPGQTIRGQRPPLRSPRP